MPGAGGAAQCMRNSDGKVKVPVTERNGSTSRFVNAEVVGAAALPCQQRESVRVEAIATKVMRLQFHRRFVSDTLWQQLEREPRRVVVDFVDRHGISGVVDVWGFR